MNDAQLFSLLEATVDAPRLVIGDRKYIHVDGRVLEMKRVGKGERWSFAPGRDVHPVGKLPAWVRRDVRVWAARAEVLDFAAHARAMGARTL